MKTSSIGTVSELKAITWLLSQDWEVFHNVKPYGPADIIIWNPETDELKKVDVKTTRAYIRTNGEKSYILSGKTVEKISALTNGVSYLGYNPEEDNFMWIENDPVH